ncbi:MAG: HEAT repeat domain-containing protein [Archangium sp.]|nr:HEAT repeat domain-containing protein [Archangium sp.]
MKRWLGVLILCVASVGGARPNNRGEAVAVLDQFMQGRTGINAAINRVQFLGEEAYVSGELIFAYRRNSNPKLREQILEFLASLGVRDREVERVFLSALASPELGEVMAGARGLGRIRSAEGVKPLIALLADPKLGPRREAARALGSIGKPAAGGPLLKAAKTETDLDLKVMMISAAGKSGDRKQIPALEALLKDESESTRLASAQGLCLMGAAKCAQFAGKLLASADENERLQGVMLFEGAAVKVSGPQLTPMLKDTNDKVRARAARLLVQGGDKKALDWLVIESAKGKGEARLVYEDELERLHLTDEQRQAILKKAGLQ